MTRIIMLGAILVVIFRLCAIVTSIVVHIVILGARLFAWLVDGCFHDGAHWKMDAVKGGDVDAS